MIDAVLASGGMRAGGASDYVETEADGDVLFVGGGGLQFGEIWFKDNAAATTLNSAAKVQITDFDAIEKVLEKTAKCFDPAHTQLHVVGWDGPWDWTWPAFQPGEELGGAEGFHQMMRTVHRLGYKNGLHMAEEAGFVPTLLVGKPDIRLDSEEASSVFAAARRFRERVRGSN